jgi:hypothetical protein
VKASDAWIFAIMGGLILWWLFGRQVNATVTGLEGEATVRYKGPLEQSHTSSPAIPPGVPPLTLNEQVTLADWLEDW